MCKSGCRIHVDGGDLHALKAQYTWVGVTCTWVEGEDLHALQARPACSALNSRCPAHAHLKGDPSQICIQAHKPLLTCSSSAIRTACLRT